jgi:hypothetical protein
MVVRLLVCGLDPMVIPIESKVKNGRRKDATGNDADPEETHVRAYF